MKDPLSTHAKVDLTRKWLCKQDAKCNARITFHRPNTTHSIGIPHLGFELLDPLLLELGCVHLLHLGVRQAVQDLLRGHRPSLVIFGIQ